VFVFPPPRPSRDPRTRGASGKTAPSRIARRRRLGEAMGVKTARTKQVRKEFKKSYKAVELCPYCRKKLNDLDGHIQAAHAFICERCGHRFATEHHWRQHMRDLHGLDAQAAVKDDAKKKIDRWVKGSKKGGKAGRRVAAARGDAMEAEDASPLASVGSFRHVCEQCGAEAMLPANLAESGLSFSCAHIGRRCGTPGPAQQAPAFGTPAPQAAPPSAFGVFAGAASAQAASPAAPAPAVSVLFGPPADPAVPPPPAAFGAGAPVAPKSAADIAVPGLEDSDEDL